MFKELHGFGWMISSSCTWSVSTDRAVQRKSKNVRCKLHTFLVSKCSCCPSRSLRESKNISSVTFPTFKQASSRMARTPLWGTSTRSQMILLLKYSIWEIDCSTMDNFKHKYLQIQNHQWLQVQQPTKDTARFLGWNLNASASRVMIWHVRRSIYIRIYIDLACVQLNHDWSSSIRISIFNQHKLIHYFESEWSQKSHMSCGIPQSIPLQSGWTTVNIIQLVWVHQSCFMANTLFKCLAAATIMYLPHWGDNYYNYVLQYTIIIIVPPCSEAYNWYSKKRCRERELTNMLPLDALLRVFLLFLLQDQLDEQLLELLIAVVDAKLLEAGLEKQ